MANSITPLSQLEESMATVIQNILSLNENQVMIAYSEFGNISTNFNDNVVYLHFTQEQDEVNNMKNRVITQDIETGEVIARQQSLRLLKLNMVFYGINALENANLVSETLHLEPFTLNLMGLDLSFIPDKTEFYKTYENINSRWWTRVDLNVYFYNTLTVEVTSGVIENINLEIKTDMEV